MRMTDIVFSFSWSAQYRATEFHLSAGNQAMPRAFVIVLAISLASILSGSLLAQDSSAPKPAAQVTLVPVDEKDLDSLIAKNKGKVVFVDYWATFCGPCKKSFPHTVELHKKHKAEGLVVVSVAFDLLEDK